MRVVLDSSVLVAAFRDTEPRNAEAFAVLERLRRGTIEAIAPVTIPIEVVAAIRRRTGRRSLAERVRATLLALPTFHLLELHAARMVRVLALASESGLRSMDAIVVSAAEELGVPLVTLDENLAARAARFVRLIDLRTLV